MSGWEYGSKSAIVLRFRFQTAAYCQYVNDNDELGFLVQVFDRIEDRHLTVEELEGAKALFPPVFVGLRATVRSGRWQRVGNIPVPDFRFPTFRGTNGFTAGKYEDWWLWDGFRGRRIGALPTELRSLEHKLVWGDELLEERIATGVNPFEDIV